MSMPKFPNSEDILTRDEAINAILTSIAAEETALSHIINAEGEKIQYAMKQCDLDRVIEVNESVGSVLDRIIDLQLILKNKMRLAEKFMDSKPVKVCCCKKKCNCDNSVTIPDDCKSYKVNFDESCVED